MAHARGFYISCCRGTEGPITVNIQEHPDPTVLAFLRSAENLRAETELDGSNGTNRGSSFYSINADYNGARFTGPSLFQYNTRNGKRRSPLEAFLFSQTLNDVS